MCVILMHSMGNFVITYPSPSGGCRPFGFRAYDLKLQLYTFNGTLKHKVILPIGMVFYL